MSAVTKPPREWQTSLSGQAITVAAHPGLPDWDQLPPSYELLAESVPAAANARALLLGCGHGALAVALARRTGEIWLLDNNLIALTTSQQTLQRNAIGNAHIHSAISLPPEQQDSFDLAVLVPPASRKLARRWLVQAQVALRVGGQIYMAGPNDGGIQPLITDLSALFGNGGQLTYRRRNRLALAAKTAEPPAMSWASEPGIAPESWFIFSTTIDGAPLTLCSLPGVFAYDRLDAGSALLLEHMPPCAGARVLDAGCGYGVLGLVAARRGAARVDLVDADLLAVAATRENISRLGLGQAHAHAADGLAGLAGHYDLIVMNPPFHSGKDVSYDSAQVMLTQAARLLAPTGQLMVVTNAFIRYEWLLGQLFGEVAALADNRRYRVLAARAPRAQ